MSDGDALLAAIAAHPDEDTPRLVYADWLDEYGDHARAEFIRLQCLAAPTEDDVLRAWHLEDEHRGRWLAAMPQIAAGRWEFRRGFPDRLVLPMDSALDQFDALARAPWLRSLEIYRCDNGSLLDFVSCNWNPRWDDLVLEEDPEVADLYLHDSALGLLALARCPTAAQLRELELNLFALGLEAAHELAESPHLAGLARLALLHSGGAAEHAVLRARFGDRLDVRNRRVRPDPPG